MGAMLGVLCTYLSRQPRYGRYAGCSVYLPSQLTVCRAPSVVSVCVPTFSRQYGRYCGCFVYLPSQRTVWVPWWMFCVPACSANNMSAIVTVLCTYLLSRQCECHGRCLVYPPSRQTVLALLWVFSIYLSSQRTILALLLVFSMPTFSADSTGAMVLRGKWMRG